MSQSLVVPDVFVLKCVRAGKGGSRGGKTSIAGVKRGADALFQKLPQDNWENATEPSEAALSDASAFPATTEASARCTPFAFAIHPNSPPPLLTSNPPNPTLNPSAPAQHIGIHAAWFFLLVGVVNLLGSSLQAANIL